MQTLDARAVAARMGWLVLAAAVQLHCGPSPMMETDAGRDVASARDVSADVPSDIATDRPVTVPETGPQPDCTSDAQCIARLPATMPPNCAEAVCDTTRGACVFRARDTDGDGARAADCRAEGVTRVEVGADCNDNDRAINPTASESCNGRDDNCNGEVDEGIAPRMDMCTRGVGACMRTGQQTCERGGWTGCTATPGAPTPDFPACDGVDHDCDGMVNSAPCTCMSGARQPCTRACETVMLTCTAGRWPACNRTDGPQPQRYCADRDGDGFYTSECMSACTQPAGFIREDGGRGGDCNDGSGGRAINPAATDVCDRVDNNCNGTVDEGAPYVIRSRPCTVCGLHSGTEAPSADGCGWSGVCNIGSVPADTTWLGNNPALHHNWGSVCGTSWCATGRGTDAVSYGPYITLAPGQYTVRFYGTHGTSSTWFDVWDATAGVALVEQNVRNSTAITSRFDLPLSFTVRDCGHQFEFRVHATYHFSINYGVTLERIVVTRETNPRL